MDEENGGIPAVVGITLRPAWSGACSAVSVHVGYAPAVIIETDRGDDGDAVDMRLDATGFGDANELADFLEGLSDALRDSPRLEWVE